MNQTFKSFSELAQFTGGKPTNKKAKTDKAIKCKVCGSAMQRIPGTNTIVCTGVSTTKDGKEKHCKNFILADNVK